MRVFSKKILTPIMYKDKKSNKTIGKAIIRLSKSFLLENMVVEMAKRR
jgi:hypothetical protein